MRTIGNTRAGETWRLLEDTTQRLPAGAIVRVERGTVLVTQEGDREDHVLEAGDEHAVGRGGLAVAWALTEAVISVRVAGLRMAA